MEALGRGILDHREPRPGTVDVELDVAVLVGASAGAVVAGEEAADQPALDHLGGERVGEIEVRHRLGFAQHRADLAPVVAAEVRPDALAKIGRLADVEDLVALTAEHVDARRSWEVRGHLELGGLRMPGEFREHHEVVEADDAEAGRTFDQEMEQVGGGERIVERAMTGPMVETEARRQRAEFAVGHLVTHEASGERDGVDDRAGQRWPLGSLARSAQEPDIEADVVADDHGVADEVDQGPQDAFDARRVRHENVGQAGQHHDLRRNRPSGIDEGLERAEALAAAHLDRTDLGDHVLVAIPARGLEVDDAERDVVQWDPQLVERSLVGKLDDRTR